MNYEDMSDYQINHAVAERIHGEGKVFISTNKNDWMAVVDDGVLRQPDYCNNPSDMWPLIAGDKISIDFDPITSSKDNPRPEAYSNSAAMFVRHENPLRACAILWLKLKEEV